MFYVNKYSKSTHSTQSTNNTSSNFHQQSLEKLKSMSGDNRLSHLIFYGPEGSGKKTLIKKFLEMTFDKSINNTKEFQYLVTGSSNVQTPIGIEQSNYHIVIEPNNNNFDRYLVQDVVNEYAKRIPLNIFTAKKPFKVVVINNIDCMSYYAQTSLRRTMEKYSDTCRFIMWCRSLTKVIDPLRSRCYCFKVGAPSQEDIFMNLVQVSCQEGYKLKLKEYFNIVKLSDNNIKTSLWLLQLKNLDIEYSTSYDNAIITIVDLILKHNIKDVLNIREIIYRIMITNIGCAKILKDILNKLIVNKDLSFDVKEKIIDAAANFEYRIVKGRREIIHIEGFIISCMNLIF